MGWNQGYTILEAQVIGLYDLGVLTVDVLNVVLEPFRGTDIDTGGERGLATKDGLSFEEVLVSVAASEETRKQLQALKAASPGEEWLDQNYASDSPDCEQTEAYQAGQKAEWAYQDARYEAVRSITRF